MEDQNRPGRLVRPFLCAFGVQIHEFGALTATFIFFCVAKKEYPALYSENTNL